MRTAEEAEWWLKEMLRWYPCLTEQERLSKEEKMRELSDKIKLLERQVDNIVEYCKLIKGERDKTQDEGEKSLYEAVLVSLDILINGL